MTAASNSEARKRAAETQAMTADQALRTALTEFIEATEVEALLDIGTQSIRHHIANENSITYEAAEAFWPAMVSTRDLRAILSAHEVQP